MYANLSIEKTIYNIYQENYTHGGRESGRKKLLGFLCCRKESYTSCSQFMHININFSWRKSEQKYKGLFFYFDLQRCFAITYKIDRNWLLCFANFNLSPIQESVAWDIFFTIPCYLGYQWFHCFWPKFYRYCRDFFRNFPVVYRLLIIRIFFRARQTLKYEFCSA